jgi:hypothetical protein
MAITPFLNPGAMLSIQCMSYLTPTITKWQCTREKKECVRLK